MEEVNVTQSTQLCTTPVKEQLSDSSSVVSYPLNTSISEKKKKPQTRTATELFGIGPAISADDATITGIRLPTCLQVLRCMMYHCNEAAHCERPGSLGAIPRLSLIHI